MNAFSQDKRSIERTQIQRRSTAQRHDAKISEFENNISALENKHGFMTLTLSSLAKEVSDDVTSHRVSVRERLAALEKELRSYGSGAKVGSPDETTVVTKKLADIEDGYKTLNTCATRALDDLKTMHEWQHDSATPAIETLSSSIKDIEAEITTLKMANKMLTDANSNYDRQSVSIGEAAIRCDPGL